MLPSLFVTPQWLSDHLTDRDIRLLDARLPRPGHSTALTANFRQGHIGDAQRMDIDVLSDNTRPLPHMLPTAEQFSRAMQEMGISAQHHLIVYDDGSLFSAPRAWWMLRCFGAQRVSLLEGGLSAWQHRGFPLQQGDARTLPEGHFPASLDTSRLRTAAHVMQALTDNRTQILDARPAARFYGVQPEPRPGLRSGHIPGSHNLPWDHLVHQGALKSPDALRALFRQAGIDLERPIIASCGSGVTASVLLLALASLGIEDTALYDGAWSEWGADSSLPVAR